MAYETIKYEVAEQILTITLNRPDKLNAFNAAMQKELIDAFDAADKDDNVRAIIVTGAGRGFCAGADLSSGADTFDRDARRGPVKRLADGKVDYNDPNVRDGGGQVTLRIFKCLKPVIAAVNGPAVGIGVTMLLAMDIRIASENARFGLCFPSAASCRRRPRAGSCRASSASRKRWSGVTPDGYFRPRKRWPAASSARWCRRTSCCRPPARWPAKSPPRPRRYRWR
jgi:1,4-dihydroxy-2-naphthoyl-CoA synthase